MDSNQNSGESEVETVGAGSEGARGQGDATEREDGSSTTATLKEALLLQRKICGSRLETARMATLAKKQAARRAAWNEKVKEEIKKRAEFKRKMEGVPLESVTNYEDKKSMSKISLQWRDGFKDERTSFLFHEVFPVVVVEHASFFELTAILQCRMASKRWKESIDSCITDLFGLYQTESGDLGHYFFHHMFTYEELVRFNKWSETAPPGRNPFFSRRLLIGPHDPPLEWKNNVGYCKEMNKLLQRWGGELLMASFYFPTGMGMEMTYEMLVKYLALMPNLRRLQTFYQDQKNIADVRIQRNLGKDVFGSLKERIARKLLPELPHLHTMLLNHFLPDPIIGALVAKYGNSLESLSLGQPFLDHDEFSKPEFTVGSGLPCMKDFSLFGWMSHSTFDFPALEEMGLENYKAKGTESVVNVFKTLNSCGSTLRRLRLVMEFPVEGFFMNDRPTDQFMTGVMRLELPRLEYILINVSNTELKNIDFLLQLGSLKELDLRYQKLAGKSHKGKIKAAPIRSSVSEEAVIQFGGYEDRLYESNIWKLFPELRLISIKVTMVVAELIQQGGLLVLRMTPKPANILTYTRDGYKQHSPQ